MLNSQSVFRNDVTSHALAESSTLSFRLVLSRVFLFFIVLAPDRVAASVYAYCVLTIVVQICHSSAVIEL